MATVPPRESEQEASTLKPQHGLSLLQVLVVVALIGLLALLAISSTRSSLRGYTSPPVAAETPAKPEEMDSEAAARLRREAAARSRREAEILEKRRNEVEKAMRHSAEGVATSGRELERLAKRASRPAKTAAEASEPDVVVIPADRDANRTPQRLPNRISWNYWIEGAKGTGLAPRVHVGRLGLNQPQQLMFRLSTQDLAEQFPRVKTLTGSPELLVAVRAALADTARATLALDVLIQSVNPKRLEVLQESGRIPVRVDLTGMRKRLADPALVMRAGARPSEDQLEAALIAQFHINLLAHASGQHELGVVIVDSDTGFPLQSMIVTVDPLKTWPDNIDVRGNGRVLGSGGAPYDLVLFLHDLGSSAYGQKSRSLHAQLYYRDPASGDRELLTWRTELDLQGLIQSSHTFHKTVASIASGEMLLDAAHDFGRSLFEPVPADGSCNTDSNCTSARRARAAIVAAASYGPQQLPPSMLVRIVSSAPASGASFASPVFPIGALGIALDDNDEPLFLGERFALALVLSDQHFEASTTCPAQWYVALPRAEDHPPTATGDALADALKGLDPLASTLEQSNQLYRQSSTLVELKRWIGNSNRGEDGAYVFAYLGHHDEGRLFLDQASAGVAVGSIRRRFGSSSIAILNACDSALSTITSGTPVGRLAQQRVESTIATTSKVSGHLAAAYLDCLTAVLEGPGKMTVGQAHALATQCLWSQAQSQRWGRNYEFSGAALKYVLIGNAHQQICRPKKEKSS